MKSIVRKTHTLDATDQAPGRLASEAARLLIGKHKPEFTPNMDLGDTVKVINASRMSFSAKKAVQKMYYSHTGHAGGVKSKSMKKVFDKNPAEVLERAVSRMLPKNRHRTERMKRLKVTN